MVWRLTASPCRAGAQWRSHETSYTEAASWDAETYNAWKELLKKEKNCGLAVRPICLHSPSAQGLALITRTFCSS